MEFKQLRSFVEVMHQGGFTQAAKNLHISQSAVSKQIAQLEQSLGTPLLERLGSQIRLTAAGSVVLHDVPANGRSAGRTGSIYAMGRRISGGHAYGSGIYRQRVLALLHAILAV